MSATRGPDLKAMTVDDWAGAITRALKARDVKGVAALVGGMAIYHPHEAESIRQMLLLGTSLAREAQR